ncbi:MAG: hypothetical protein H7301_00360 [Cryobacterium sp.]|nr:hypothetical protein [Oligoflexia bacterium]
MKSIVKMFLPLIALVSFSAFANDHDAKATTESSHDVSKNPITGSVTETTKQEADVKVGDAKKKRVRTHKTKTSKDGMKKTTTIEEEVKN